jgi:hypothetical protein
MFQTAACVTENCSDSAFRTVYRNIDIVNVFKEENKIFKFILLFNNAASKSKIIVMYRKYCFHCFIFQKTIHLTGVPKIQSFLENTIHQCWGTKSLFQYSLPLLLFWKVQVTTSNNLVFVRLISK